MAKSKCLTQRDARPQQPGKRWRETNVGWAKSIVVQYKYEMRPFVVEQWLIDQGRTMVGVSMHRRRLSALTPK